MAKCYLLQTPASCFFRRKVPIAVRNLYPDCVSPTTWRKAMNINVLAGISCEIVHCYAQVPGRAVNPPDRLLPDYGQIAVSSLYPACVSPTTWKKTINNNVLAGIYCQKCGSVDCFKIYASATFTVHDYGTDHFETVEYNYSELLGLLQDVRDYLDYYTYQQKQQGFS